MGCIRPIVDNRKLRPRDYVRSGYLLQVLYSAPPDIAILVCRPKLEFHWSWNQEWDGRRQDDIVGGFEKEGRVFTGRENPKLRRKAVSIQDLDAAAPQLIHKMLADLQTQRGAAFAGANGDGKLDANDMLTEKEIMELYKGLNVNLAELLGLRLYTGRQAHNSFQPLAGARECVADPMEFVCRTQVLCLSSIIRSSVQKESRSHGATATHASLAT